MMVPEAKNFIRVTHTGGSNLSAWTVLHCFPRCISEEMVSRRGSNWCSEVACWPTGGTGCVTLGLPGEQGTLTQRCLGLSPVIGQSLRVPRVLLWVAQFSLTLTHRSLCHSGDIDLWIGTFLDINRGADFNLSLSHHTEHWASTYCWCFPPPTPHWGHETFLFSFIIM